ncbi:MAG TPA: hypothetical protein VGQ95_03675 [Chthoniobacterales bacterium]|nr:hypothetical protein [Chthoniobacterales bacterium]
METAHHAEALTARSREQSLGFTPRANGVLPIYDPLKVRNAAKLIGGAFVYRQLRVFQTLLTLEIPFADTRRGDLPEPAPTEEQRRNLAAHNARIDQPMLLVTGGGIVATAGEEDTEATTFVSIGFNKDTGKFGIGPLGLAKFKQAHSTQIVQGDWFQQIGDVLLVLKVGYIAARNAKLLDQVLRYGFISVRATMLPEFFAAAEIIVAAIKDLLPEWSYSDFNATVQRLRQLGIEMGYAPPVRAAGDLALLDLHSASHLLNVFFIKSINKQALQRGPSFEDDIQHLIDETKWKPPEEIRGWRGRKLKVNDTVLTDIDAVGLLGGHLLVIEAKAIYYELGYGSFDRSQARNAREKCEFAVRQCARDDLRQATNLHLAQFRQIVRVVCTPSPIYCEADYATPGPDGFSQTMSYWEVFERLSKDQ